MIYFSDLKQMFWTHGEDEELLWFDTEKQAKEYLESVS